jgi:hypothetical protein
MNRSVAIGVVAVVLIGGAVAYLVMRPPSTASRERDEAGWRVCGACGHTWHMDLAQIQQQVRQDPEGNGWVQCPKCHAWRGLPAMRCPKCNTLYGAYNIDESGARLSKCRTCPRCGYTLGSDQPDTSDETE